MYIGKKTISLIEHIHPGGQTATVMNTTLSENYSVLYPAVVEDEKGSGRHVDRHTHTYTHARNEGGKREEKQKRGGGEREQTRISRPHKPVNKICGADKL